jgi:hypothetical protein
MTDARFPERWLNDRRLLRLSDAAFRLFVISLTWSVANKTDGLIYDGDLPLIVSPTDPGHDVDGYIVRELVKSGLWERVADYWLITVFDETQTTREQLEAAAAARRKARDKKRRQRAAASAVPRDVPRDNTRPGQARPGAKTEGRAPP